MAFCDYCACETCQQGLGNLFHALTADQNYICDTCFTYECCLNRTVIKHGNKERHDPCDDDNCESRPKLISHFIQNEVIKPLTI